MLFYKTDKGEECFTAQLLDDNGRQAKFLNKETTDNALNKITGKRGSYYFCN